MRNIDRRQVRREIIKQMVLAECACEDEDYEMPTHGGRKFHHNGPEQESDMIRSNLFTMSKKALEMHDGIAIGDDLPEWVQEKIAVAGSMIDSVYDYLDYQYRKPDDSGMDGDGELLVDDSYEFEDHDDFEDYEDSGEYDDYEITHRGTPMGHFDMIQEKKKADKRSVTRKYKGDTYKATPAMVKAVKSGASVEKLMKMADWAKNPGAVVQAAKIVAKGKPMKRGGMDEADLEDAMRHEPWQPLRQSTGIMFFEEEED